MNHSFDGGSRSKSRRTRSKAKYDTAEIQLTENSRFIVASLQDMVLFPGNQAKLVMTPAIGRAVEYAMQKTKGLVFATAIIPEKQQSFGNSEADYFYPVGTIAIIERVDQNPAEFESSHLKTFLEPNMPMVVLRGLNRASVTKIISSNVTWLVTARLEVDSETNTTKAIFLMRQAKKQFSQLLTHGLPIDQYDEPDIMNEKDPGKFCDAITPLINLSIEEQQTLLELFNTEERLERLIEYLRRELDVAEIEQQSQQKVQQEMDRGQREYLLREQIRVLQRELAETDPNQSEYGQMRATAAAAQMPEEIYTRTLREIERMESMPVMAPEYSMLRSYVDWLITLPWHKQTTDNLNVKAAEAALERNHYGLAKVKERLIEFIAVRKLAPESRSPIICLIGPPGVGKTSLGKSVAEALGRVFVRLSLGGVHDEAEIRGHRRTYVGALPGRIIQTMRRAGVINPLFMLDEIDKLTSDSRGDPSSALLEVLDPEQNYMFSDHYLEVSYDLSHVIFFLTANTMNSIPHALLDRMEIIELPGYTEQEKLLIARDHLLPRIIKDHGLDPAKLAFQDDAVQSIIREYTYEAGVRSLEREMSAVLRKIARKTAEGSHAKFVVDAKKLPQYLGPPKNALLEAEKHNEVGVAMGVAWSSAGGDLTPIEVSIAPGKGVIQLTGSLGETLRESAQAALSYVRSHAAELTIAENFYEHTDIHIHLPMNAVPKDGPSAGVPIAIAIISALTGRPVVCDAAMTGEITLRGHILPVGGLKEKFFAAYRAGLRRFILPAKNKHDLRDIPADALKAVKVIYAEDLAQVIALTLLSANKAELPEYAPASAAPLATRAKRMPHMQDTDIPAIHITELGESADAQL